MIAISCITENVQNEVGNPYQEQVQGKNFPPHALIQKHGEYMHVALFSSSVGNVLVYLVSYTHLCVSVHLDCPVSLLTMRICVLLWDMCSFNQIC